MPTLHRSTRIAICCAALGLAACAKKDDSAATDTSNAMTSSTATTVTSAPAPAPAPTPINLADVAGKWNMRAVPASGDTTPVTFVLTAKSTTSGWTIKFPGRAPIAERITVAGDSVITEAGPYSSILRKGVQVTTNGTFRLQGGNLVGTNTAHYSVKTADSVLMLNTTGMRAK